ncbi:hypothetical protein JGU63_09905 [Staphylococcus aureus]|nr:hypothetical protein [Staphylococcus aureus]
MNVKKAFSHNIERQICIITRPEIEILMILSLDKFEDYQKVKAKKKPSVFMKELVKENVKSENYLKEFYDKHCLIDAIKKYHEVRPDKKQYSLKDILK